MIERWRAHYKTQRIRVKWMADELASAVRMFEDMEADVGLATGHVGALGVNIVGRLLRALMACHHAYLRSPKWMLKLDQLIAVSPPDVRATLVEGRELLFPPLFASPVDGFLEPGATSFELVPDVQVAPLS